MFFEKYQQFLVKHRNGLIKIVAVFALLIVIFELGRSTTHIGVVGELLHSPEVYSALCIVPVTLLLISRQFTINYVLLLFCLACMISVIINHPSEHFMSPLRLCMFGGLLCLISPLIDSEPLLQVRRWMWRIMVMMLQGLVWVAFLLYMLKIAGITKLEPTVVGGHSNTLGVFTAFVAIVSVSRLLNKEITGAPHKIYYILTAVMSTVMTVYCGSRSALLGLAIALIYLLAVCKDRKRVIWAIASFAIIIGGLTVVSGQDITGRVQRKFEIGIKHNSLIYSRQKHWQSRLEEFKESPVIGIGFAAVTRYSRMTPEQVASCEIPSKEEPASSWLSVLSNTGLIGFAIMVWWNVLLFLDVRRRRRSGDVTAAMLGALLIFFIVEGMFEGWVLYAGSTVFFLYWLLTSQIVLPVPAAARQPMEGRL